jgi:PAS domain S-box-containing protein
MVLLTPRQSEHSSPLPYFHLTDIRTGVTYSLNNHSHFPTLKLWRRLCTLYKVINPYANMNQKELSASNPSPNTRENGDQKADEEQRQDVASERELIGENHALEAKLAVMQSEDAEPEQDEEARQVARAGDGSQRGIVQRQENVFQNQAEVQLRLLETAIEQSNESVIITTAQLDPAGPKIIYVNPAFTKMTGYASEEVIGKTPRILQGPKTDLSLLGQLRKDCAAGKVFHGEMINYRKDRSEIHLEWTAGPVRNERGEVTHFAVAQRDVTERRRIEEALRDSERQLRAILDHSVAVVFVKDLEGRYLRINRWYEVLHGVTEAELKGKTDYDLHVKEIADAVRANDQEVIASNTPLQFEERVLAADGLHDFIVVKFPLRDDSGRPYAVCGIATDITERKRAETGLRESESRLRQHMDAMPQIVYTCRADGMSDYVNQRWQEYTGVSWERALGAGWVESLHADDRERAWRQWEEAVKAGQPFEIEYRIRRKDGHYRWYLSRTIPLRDRRQQIIGWIGTSTDIHDRKEAEAEREELLVREQAARADAEHAAESIRRLQAVSDSALTHHTLDDLLHEMLARIQELLATDSAAILLLTEDGQSLAVCAATGLEEVGGPHIPVGQGVAGSIAASRVPLIVEDLSTVEVVHPILRQKARSLIGAPLIVEDRLIGVIRTETTHVRRFTENEVRLLQLAADRVAVAIEQARLYEVELQARRQAEEANHMKDEFLALVSHELRSPLNAILGYAALLRRGEGDAQKVKQAVEVIERSGKAQAQLIDDLLDTARIISGKLRLEIGPVDLVSVIDQAIQTIRLAADAKGLSLEVHLPPEGVQITGDPTRLQQVVWNLLSNAVKFTPQGGRIEVRLERIDPHICITVSDTGKGIPPDFLPFVFDRFRQADASSAKRYGGLGLGLALVKRLVELHGGTVEVISAGEDRGATFKVTLPVRAVSSPFREAGGAPVRAASPEELAGVRALVVDDEDDARELLKAALTQHGAKVVAVSSAAEAFALILSAPDRERPDVLVADIGMPGEDGYSLIRRVRELERERDFYTPAVALTAYGRAEDCVRALTAGFQAHIAKPVDPTELATVIESLISRPNRSEKT